MINSDSGYAGGFICTATLDGNAADSPSTTVTASGN